MIKNILLTTVLVIFLGVLLGAWQWLNFLDASVSSDNRSVIYEVKSGKGFSQVSTELGHAGLVTNPLYFKWLARLSGKAGQLKVGEYSLSPNMKPREVLEILTSGKSREYPVTFQEGLNIFEMADVIEQRGLGTRQEFLNLVKNPQLSEELLGEKLPSLEGYLFPETYQITKYTGLKGLIRLMVANFKNNYATVSDRLPAGFDRHQVVTLASVIEKETGAPEERPLISSVFHNRLQKGMKLQSDPTIIYGIWETTLVMPANIHRKDILAPTRYNTYTVAALPYGPIANPGREALAAAVTPETSPYLYFVSRNDGTHVFTSTYEDHLKAVKKFQLDQRAREGKSWRDLKKRASSL